MKKKQEESLLEWCETQEEKTNRVVDELLDNHNIKDKKVKKALTITSKILKSIDELKEITKEIVQ
jgi:predicted transcriptional regulator